MRIGSLRGWLYWLARILGDVNAVHRGRAGRRVGRVNNVCRITEKGGRDVQADARGRVLRSVDAV